MTNKNNSQNEKKIVIVDTHELNQVDNELIDEAIDFINEKVNESIYKGSIEIGEYILAKFFDNNIQLASSRNPKKPNSYAALCKRDDLNANPATLSIMVRIAAQERFFDKYQIDASKLNYTQKKELIKIDNEKLKIELANECINNNLSTREFEKIVKAKRLDNKSASDLPNTSSQIINSYISSIDSILKKIQFPKIDKNSIKAKRLRSEKIKEYTEKADRFIVELEKAKQSVEHLKSEILNFEDTSR